MFKTIILATDSGFKRLREIKKHLIIADLLRYNWQDWSLKF